MSRRRCAGARALGLDACRARREARRARIGGPEALARTTCAMAGGRSARPGAVARRAAGCARVAAALGSRGPGMPAL